MYVVIADRVGVGGNAGTRFVDIVESYLEVADDELDSQVRRAV